MDEDEFESMKFDECHMCTNRFCEETCDDCDSGEWFEEELPDDLNKLFKDM